MANESNSLKKTLSKKNPYYISKHRYYELRQFCLQYKEWCKLLRSETDPVRRLYYQRCIKLIDTTLLAAGDDLYMWLRTAIIEDCSYVYLRNVLGTPCCKDTYYDIYHRFFYELSNRKMEICEK